MTAASYYPALRYLLFAPGVTASMAFLLSPAGLEKFVFPVCSFLVVFGIWRRQLRMLVREGQIVGREPTGGRKTTVQLRNVVSVREGELSWGKIPGWIFEDSTGKEVFVPSSALDNQEVGSVFESCILRLNE